MSDKLGERQPLSAEERRLIDEAVAAGRVTRVPMGACGRMKPQKGFEASQIRGVAATTGKNRWRFELARSKQKK